MRLRIFAVIAVPLLALMPACGKGLYELGETAGETTTLTFSQSGPLSFGISTYGLAVQRVVTLNNAGASTASGLSSAAVTGSAFSLLGGSWPGTGGTCAATLAAGQSCTFALNFGPQASGSHSGAFQLNVVRAGVGFPLAGDATGGGFDTSFGSGGAAMVDPLYTTGSLAAVIRQSDGRIVGGGSVSAGFQNHWLLTRWNSDGSVDTTFGGGTGFVVTPVASSTNSQSISQLAIQTDGKIVAGGVTNPTSYYHFGVARYLTDGTLDSTFDGDGIRMDTISPNSHAAGSDMAIQSDGKIVVAGGDGNTGSWKFGIIRYTTNGALDNTFSGDGLVSQAFGTFVDYPLGVAIQSDGRLVLAAVRDISFPATGTVVVARFLTDGSVDTSFDTDGISVLPVTTDSASVRGIALQTDGKIVVVGDRNPGFFDSDVVLYRFLTDGSLDGTFGTGGVAQMMATGMQHGVGLAIASDGKMFVARSLIPPMGMLRANTDGTLDSSFGADGVTSLTIGTGNSGLNKLRVLPDGKVIGAGYTQASGKNFPAVFRFFP